MRTHPRTAAIVLALAAALAGTACGEQARDAMQQAAAEAKKDITDATGPGGEVEKSLAEARRKLHEEPIDLSHKDAPGKAQLTPEGELIIDGQAVPMDAAQREAALAYRAKLLAVADAGLVVGQQGAALGGEAAALAIGALLGGGNVDAEETKRKIEAEAQKIKTAALALCRDAKALEVEQARFAEIVPEFAPYAKKIDIDADCEDGDGEPAAADTVSA